MKDLLYKLTVLMTIMDPLCEDWMNNAIADVSNAISTERYLLTIDTVYALQQVFDFCYSLNKAQDMTMILSCPGFKPRMPIADYVCCAISDKKSSIILSLVYYTRNINLALYTFTTCVKENLFDVAKDLYPHVNITNKYMQDMFNDGCTYGKLGLLKFLVSLPNNNIDLRYDGETPLLYAVEENRAEVVHWLLCANNTIDIEINENYAFTVACENGSFDVAAILYYHCPKLDVTAQEHYAFKKACENKHLKIIEFLIKLNPMYQVRRDGKDFVPVIKSYVVVNEPVDAVDCHFCYDRKTDCKANCGHQFCSSCLHKLRSTKCPFCNQDIKTVYKKTDLINLYSNNFESINVIHNNTCTIDHNICTKTIIYHAQKSTCITVG